MSSSGEPSNTFSTSRAQRRPTGGFSFDERLVAVSPAVFGVADVSLLLQRAEDGQNGRVGEIISDPLADLGDGGRADVQSTLITSSSRPVKLMCTGDSIY